MRTINRIVAHCTGTVKEATVEAILRYWRETLGWNNPGYHYIIPTDGRVIQLLGERHIANGAQGFNSDSIHLSYIGGLDENENFSDTRTHQQKRAMYGLILELLGEYENAELFGHRDLPGVARECPCFDTADWYRNHQISLTT